MAMNPAYAIHFVADMGVRFTREPTLQHGITLAEFVDPDGARVSLSG